MKSIITSTHLAVLVWILAACEPISLVHQLNSSVVCEEGTAQAFVCERRSDATLPVMQSSLQETHVSLCSL